MDSLLWNQSVNTYLPLKMLFRVTKRSSLVLNRVEKRRVFVLTQGLKAHSARHTSFQTSLECPHSRVNNLKKRITCPVIQHPQ